VPALAALDPQRTQAEPERYPEALAGADPKSLVQAGKSAHFLPEWTCAAEGGLERQGPPDGYVPLEAQAPGGREPREKLEAEQRAHGPA